MQAPRSTIRLFALDVDGTLTDGTFTYGSGGSESKTFNAKDGLAVKVLPAIGITTALISGRESEAVRRRAKELRIDEVHLGVDDKLAVLHEIVSRHDLTIHEAAFMGDDLSDIPAMRAAGWSAAPADAVPEARETAAFVARRNGGHGAVRDAIEHLLRFEGLWETVLERFQVIPSQEPSA